MRPIPRVLIVAAALATAAGRVLADGVILNGVSAYTIGRAGTNIAFADNSSMLHDNPAAMGQIAGESMFQFGVTGLFTDLEYTDPDNAARGQRQLYPLPEISYVRRLSDEWSYGMGIFTPAGFGSIFTLNGPAPFGGPQRYSSFGSLNKLLTGISYSPTDRLSFGATIGPGLTFADLQGPYTLQGPSAFAGLPTLLDIEVDGFALVWSAGVYYRLTDSTTIGATYQSESDIDAHGNASIITPLGATDYDAHVGITWPQSVGLGLRQQLASRHVLAADVIWFNWADAFDTFDITLTNPTNIGFPPIFEQYPLFWRDSLSTRVGYEYHFVGGQVARAGYAHYRTAMSEATMTPFIPAAFEHAFSLGYGWNMLGWNVNLAYMYQYGPTAEVGTSALVGGDFNDSANRDQTHAAAISFMRTFGCGRTCRCGDAVSR